MGESGWSAAIASLGRGLLVGEQPRSEADLRLPSPSSRPAAYLGSPAGSGLRREARGASGDAVGAGRPNAVISQVSAILSRVLKTVRAVPNPSSGVRIPCPPRAGFQCEIAGQRMVRCGGDRSRPGPVVSSQRRRTTVDCGCPRTMRGHGIRDPNAVASRSWGVELGDGGVPMGLVKRRGRVGVRSGCRRGAWRTGRRPCGGPGR